MRQKPVSEAVEILGGLGILKKQKISKEHNVGAISYNSKKADSSTLFVCKGSNFKDKYLVDAVESGVFCYVSEKEYEGVDCDFIIVSDIRLARAALAKWFYEYDENSPKIIGVTGTKGKSTVVYFIKNILTQAGIKCGYITTIDTFDGVKSEESVLTTPESLELYEILYRAKTNGCRVMVLEISSQAEKMHRIEGLQIEAGVFVNISDDHISPHEHQSFEEYLMYKGMITSRFRTAIINLDDEHSGDIITWAQKCPANRVLTYSVKNEDADYYASNITKDGFRSLFEAVTPDAKFNAMVQIPGEFNVANALAAIAVGELFGVSEKDMIAAVLKTQVSGRMNIFRKGKYIAVVDYAHNKHSLDSALNALKEYYPHRQIVLVFGCPGEKALQRRHDMAKVASKYVKYVYVTSEDPGRVDPKVVAEEITGYLDKYNTPSEIILDRKEAVREAVNRLAADEILIVAGKGSEHYQVVGGVTEYYESDTELAEKYIMEK